MQSDTLHFERQDEKGIITLNRPDVLNALNSQFFRDLTGLLDQLAADPVRVVILTGEGKAFAAGADIAEMAGMTQSQASDFSRRGQAVFQRLEDLDYPVIAAVNGYALGGGCELCMACDMRIASVRAKFGQPEVKLGLIPGFGATQRLVRHVGLGNALYMLTSGRNISAEEAQRMGLVQEITDPDHLMERVHELAGEILAVGPEAVRKVKSVIRKSALGSLPEGYEREAEQFGILFEGQGAEGMKAFLEKRKPSW
jgi:enoyl-CoA hydratase